ncbi:MAG: Ig-like domain-containing protein [Gemmatimonadaceae bacterium]
MQFERVIRRRTQAALALLLAASAFGAVGCKDSKSSTAPVVPYLVTVTPVSSNLAVGGTQQLTATVKDFYNNTMSTPVTWESSIPTVATVSATGLVTMVKAGSTTIVARVAPGNGQAHGSAVVSSASAVATLVVGAPTTLAIPLTLQLAPLAFDATGGQLLPGDISYSSSAPSIISVSAKGLLTAVSAGTATITVTSGGKSATANVQAIVFTPVASVSLSPLSTSLAIGGTQQLTAVIQDGPGNVLTGKPLTYASSAPTVASVSQDGLVTLLTAGNAIITATSETKSATVGVTSGSNTLLLLSGVSKTALAGPGDGSSKIYQLFVPAGATGVTITLSGGTGDPDILLYRTGVPVDLNPNETGVGSICISGRDVGLTETCSITGANAAVPGYWSLQIIGFATYAGWTLSAVVTP